MSRKPLRIWKFAIKSPFHTFDFHLTFVLSSLVFYMCCGAYSLVFYMCCGAYSLVFYMCWGPALFPRYCLSLLVSYTGSVYLHDCGRAPLVPHYLIVYGCTLVLMSVFAIILILSLCSGAGLTLTIVVFVLLILFNVAWLITGMYIGCGGQILNRQTFKTLPRCWTY